MASNYKDNFDYAEAIANTQDAGERQQLLAERQNKIESRGWQARLHPTTLFPPGTALTVPIRFPARKAAAVR